MEVFYLITKTPFTLQEKRFGEDSLLTSLPKDFSEKRTTYGRQWSENQKIGKARQGKRKKDKVYPTWAML